MIALFLMFKEICIMISIVTVAIYISMDSVHWEIDGETVETVSDLIFGGSKITADGGYSHKIKRCLFL